MLLAKAIFSRKYNCSIPKLGNNLELQQARNLPLQWDLRQRGIELQAIDIELQNKVNIITGTNMAGKTTTLKTIGQVAYLTSCGIPVPCQKAVVPLAEFIFFSGCQQNRMDLSSFASEVVEINQVLAKPAAGLILIDEFARGTNPEEGEAFSKAVLEAFLAKSSLVVAATHFTAPSQIKQAAHFRIKGITSDNYKQLQQLSNLQNRLQELHKFMDYSLKRVAANSQPPKAALVIAEILGIDGKIIDKAKDYLNDE
jgi:dsDNA-specific endonuclease/ATPase MutS2